MIERSDFMRESPEMDVDPISDILSLTEARTAVAGGFTIGGDWAIRFPAPGKVKFFAVEAGDCRLTLDGGAPPVAIRAGDIFLPSAAVGFTLSGGVGARPLDARALFADPSHEPVDLGGVGDCRIVGGHVHLHPVSGHLLAEILPPLIHVPGAAEAAAPMRLFLDRLLAEWDAGSPGAAIVRAQLAQLVFVHLIRAYLAEAEGPPRGILRAMGDPRLRQALSLIHGDPARHWRLTELAGAAGMSRTNFALRFRDAAGIAPLAYLTQWRMRLADRMLGDGEKRLAAIAAALGYASESAFSTAYKRVTGCSPSDRRRAAQREAIDADR